MKHGMTGTRIYNIWKDMKKRCYCKSRKDYSRYGGRGITVCKEWQEFIPFYNWAMNNGYTDNLTIDRIDVNGNYEPSNCRWVTTKEQANNKRNNHFVAFNGETMTIAQCGKKIGMCENTIRKRIKSEHFTETEVFSKPLQQTHYITYNGETKSLKQWAKCKGISYSTLHKRIFKLHWNIDRALTTK